MLPNTPLSQILSQALLSTYNERQITTMALSHQQLSPAMVPSNTYLQGPPPPDTAKYTNTPCVHKNVTYVKCASDAAQCYRRITYDRNHLLSNQETNPSVIRKVRKTLFTDHIWGQHHGCHPKTCSPVNHLGTQHKIKVITTNRPHKAHDQLHRHPILITLVDETSQYNHPPHISPSHTSPAPADVVDNAIPLPLLETPDMKPSDKDHHPKSPGHGSTYYSDHDLTGDNIQLAEPKSIPILITNAETHNIYEKGTHPTCLIKITPTCELKIRQFSACLLNVRSIGTDQKAALIRDYIQQEYIDCAAFTETWL